MEKIRKKKAELTELMREFKELEDHHERQKEGVTPLIYPNGMVFDVFGGMKPNTKDGIENYFITMQTVRDWERNQTPKGVDLDDTKGGAK